VLAKELLTIIRRLILEYQSAPYARTETAIQALLPLIENRSDEALEAVENLDNVLAKLPLTKYDHAQLSNLISELEVAVAPIIGDDGKPIEPKRTK